MSRAKGRGGQGRKGKPPAAPPRRGSSRAATSSVRRSLS